MARLKNSKSFLFYSIKIILITVRFIYYLQHGDVFFILICFGWFITSGEAISCFKLGLIASNYYLLCYTVLHVTLFVFYYIILRLFSLINFTRILYHVYNTLVKIYHHRCQQTLYINLARLLRMLQLFHMSNWSTFLPMSSRFIYNSLIHLNLKLVYILFLVSPTFLMRTRGYCRRQPTACISRLLQEYVV